MMNKFKRTACRNFEALLEDHLAGDPGGPEAVKLSEHLKSCAGCQAALALAVASSRLLAAAEPTPDPGPGFTRVVMAYIRTQQQHAGNEKGIWLPFVSVAWRFAAVASLGIVALLTFGTRTRPAAQENLAQLRLPQAYNLVADPNNPPETRDEILMMMAENNHGKH
jgi:predicted anti-sigma-YlaC factor YlaD